MKQILSNIFVLGSAFILGTTLDYCQDLELIKVSVSFIPVSYVVFPIALWWVKGRTPEQSWSETAIKIVQCALSVVLVHVSATMISNQFSNFVFEGTKTVRWFFAFFPISFSIAWLAYWIKENTINFSGRVRARLNFPEFLITPLIFGVVFSTVSRIYPGEKDGWHFTLDNFLFFLLTVIFWNLPRSKPRGTIEFS